jgi:hypothetical protein
MAVQDIAPNDECTVSAIGNQPSAVSSGSEANQVLPPEVPTAFRRESIRGMPPVVMTAVSRAESNASTAGYGQIDCEQWLGGNPGACQ